MLKPGEVLGKRGQAGHPSGSSSLHPRREFDCRLISGSGGLTSLVGPGKVTVRNSGCVVAEKEEVGSMQFKEGKYRRRVPLPKTGIKFWRAGPL